MALYTMGYEGLDGGRFLANLLHHGVDVVADIRKSPISRKKGFSKTALKEMLNNKNIEYLNFQGFGAPKEIRDGLYQSGNYSRFFNKYLKCIADKHDKYPLFTEYLTHNFCFYFGLPILGFDHFAIQ